MSSSPTFLTLPPEIRLKIYILADLLRFCPISLNNEGSRKAYREQSLWQYVRNYPDEATDMRIARRIYCAYWTKKFMTSSLTRETPDAECICPPLPIQLLTVCRSIHEEVFEILYSQNKFKWFLQRNIPLPPKAVAKMTSLSIRLNMCSCVPHHFCEHPSKHNMRDRCHLCHATCKRGRDPPLSVMSTQGMDIFRHWIEVCGILQTGLGPNMRLGVICDCADMVTAQKIVEPIRELPKVMEFSIRLGQSRLMPWRQIAEDTVLLLMDRPPTRPFRFVDLPRELQTEILYYTDLISPYILEWDAYLYLNRRQRGIRPFEQHDSICCMRCTDAAEACSCTVNHAAFSSVQCICWSYPAALFRVSRDMNYEATVIFFSENKFLIREEPWPFDEQPGMRQALTVFQHLPSLALRNLRWIRFNRGFYSRLEVYEGSTPLAGWKETAQFMAENFDTSNLTIELDLLYGHDDVDVYTEETATHIENAWRSYQNMAEVFIFKDGLKDFFVHLASPCDWPTMRDLRPRMERERILEKRIMGPEYDGETRGKRTNRGVSVVDLFHQQPAVYAPDGSIINGVA